MRALAFIAEIILKIVLFIYWIILFPIVIANDIVSFFVNINTDMFNKLSNFVNENEIE